MLGVINEQHVPLQHCDTLCRGSSGAVSPEHHRNNEHGGEEEADVTRDLCCAVLGTTGICGSWVTGVPTELH